MIEKLEPWKPLNLLDLSIAIWRTEIENYRVLVGWFIRSEKKKGPLWTGSWARKDGSHSGKKAKCPSPTPGQWAIERNHRRARI